MIPASHTPGARETEREVYAVRRLPIRQVTLALCCLLAVILSGCGKTEQTTQEPEKQTIQSERPDWERATVTADAQGEPCFALSPEEFLQRYNTVWTGQGGEALSALDQWMDYGVGRGAYEGGASGHQYLSLTDASNYAEPFLALCITEDGTQVKEVVTGLSQKNYGEGPGGLFQTKTYCALQALLPGLDPAGFDDLYQALFADGTYAEAGTEVLPLRVYYQDGLACYGTLQIGSCDQIHLRAADQALLDWWQNVGVEIMQGIPGMA